MNLIFFVPVPLDDKSVDSFSPPMRRKRKRETAGEQLAVLGKF